MFNPLVGLSCHRYFLNPRTALGPARILPMPLAGHARTPIGYTCLNARSVVYAHHSTSLWLVPNSQSREIFDCRALARAPAIRRGEAKGTVTRYRAATAIAACHGTERIAERCRSVVAARVRNSTRHGGAGCSCLCDAITSPVVGEDRGTGVPFRIYGRLRPVL